MGEEGQGGQERAKEERRRRRRRVEEKKEGASLAEAMQRQYDANTT